MTTLLSQTPATSMYRLIPDAINGADPLECAVMRGHLERYEFACRYLAGKRVLDLACGAGYGSARMAEVASRVVGVDADESAVAYASARYQRANATFVSQRYEAFSESEPAGTFDAAVSLETVAHVMSPEHFLSCCHRLLRPGGVLVLSAPVTPSTDFSPLHRHDFTRRELLWLVASSGFAPVDYLAQRDGFSLRQLVASFRAASSGPGWRSELRQDLAAYYLRHPRVLLRRLGGLARYGLANCYFTVVARKLPERGVRD